MAARTDKEEWVGVMGRAVGDFSGVLDLPAVLEASTAVRSASSLLAGLQGQPLQCASFVQLFCSVEGDLQEPAGLGRSLQAQHGPWGSSLGVPSRCMLARRAGGSAPLRPSAAH